MKPLPKPGRSPQVPSQEGPATHQSQQEEWCIWIISPYLAYRHHPQKPILERWSQRVQEVRYQPDPGAAQGWMATQEISLLALAIVTVSPPAVLPFSGCALLFPYNQDIPKDLCMVEGRSRWFANAFSAKTRDISKPSAVNTSTCEWSVCGCFNSGYSLVAS